METTTTTNKQQQTTTTPTATTTVCQQTRIQSQDAENDLTQTGNTLSVTFRSVPFVRTARTQICAHVKDHMCICRKREGLAAGGIKTREHYRRKKSTTTQIQCSAVLCLLAFPGESSPNCPCLGQESYPI